MSAKEIEHTRHISSTQPHLDELVVGVQILGDLHRAVLATSVGHIQAIVLEQSEGSVLAVPVIGVVGTIAER